MKKGGPGYHPIAASGEGIERLPETRPYEFGDDFQLLDPLRSLHNALKRTHGELALAEGDLEIHETEHLTSCASVLAIDISHSMVLYGEDRITPARKLALALTELIQSRYPKDHIEVVLFGDRAQRVPIAELAHIQAGPFHTNTSEALQGRAGCWRGRSTPQEICHQTATFGDTEGNGGYKKHSARPQIVNLTLKSRSLPPPRVVSAPSCGHRHHAHRVRREAHPRQRGRAFFPTVRPGRVRAGDYLRIGGSAALSAEHALLDLRPGNAADHVDLLAGEECASTRRC